MFRTHNCGELRLSDTGKKVSISGWVQIGRDFGGLTFVDLRDRYGITQVVFDQDDNAELADQARKLGREWVIQVNGTVRERTNKNANRSTGDVEIVADELIVLNSAKTPPFTIEDESDGGDDIRMQYRYLDLRRGPLQQNIMFRSKLALAVRAYLGGKDFVEIETPFLIKSTPEGARDFVVPSRLNEGQFYALPQSPQTFKQLLMVAGYDRYFQIVKCFRDEDLRADRQPEFTQIDCEMAFVTQEQILNTFEGLTRHVFQELKNVELPEFPRMQYDDAIRLYGSDKPDLRFGMPLVELNEVAQNKGFGVFDSAELVVAICVPGKATLTRKGGLAGDANSDDEFGTVKHTEALVLSDLIEFDQRHAKAQVGLIRSVKANRVIVLHPGEFGQFNVFEFLENVAGEAFEGIEDLLLGNEGHFAVNLREFRLTVSAEVFVAEALHDLEVAVVASYHQQLLEGLWALRKGVELAFIEAAGDHEITRTFGRRLNQEGRLNLHKVLTAEVSADGQGELGAEHDVLL